MYILSSLNLYMYKMYFKIFKPINVDKCIIYYNKSITSLNEY